MKSLFRLFSAFGFACAVLLFSACPAAQKDAEDTDLYILDMQPAGELPSAVKYPSVFVQFSKPVVPLASLGKPSGVSEYMKIEPPLQGVYRWYGTSLLCFDSSEAVIPQREYRVTVSPDITASDGTPVSGQLSYTFRTEELAFLNVIPGYETVQTGGYVDPDDVPPEDARSVALLFSYPVDPGIIHSSLEILAFPESAAKGGETLPLNAGGENQPETDPGTEQEGIPLAFSISRPDGNRPELLLAALKKDPPENAEIRITLKSGARAEKDALPTTEDQSRSFHTLRPFTLISMSPGVSGGEQEHPVDFLFSHRIAGDTDLSALTVRTEPPMETGADNLLVSGNRIRVHGLPVDFGQTYRISLEGEITDVYGRVIAVSTVLRSVRVPEAASYAAFKNYGAGILESQFEPKLVFEYQNVLSGSFFTVQAVTGPQAWKAVQTRLDPDKIPENTRILQPVDLRPFLTERNGKFSGAVQFNAGIFCTSRWSDDEPYVYRNEQVIQVTDLAITARCAFNRAVVLVSSLSSGEPVPGAVVSVYVSGETLTDAEEVALDNPCMQAVTDAQGFAVLDFSSPSSGFQQAVLAHSVWESGVYLRAEKDGDTVVTDLSGAGGNRVWGTGAAIGSLRDAVRAEQVTFLFTDRGLYKPGETLKVRGIDRNLQRGAYTNYSGPYHLAVEEDRWKGETLSTVSGSTSAGGGFDASFVLPRGIAPGAYRLRYWREDPGDATLITFRVEHFERLRFASACSVADLTYFRGDRISASVSASYLGGGSLAGASWRGNWYREPTWFRAEGDRFDGFLFGPQQGYEGRRALSTETGVLDGSGETSASQLSGGENTEGRPYLYRLESTVTDAGGQAVSASASAVVHPAQFYIGLSAPENTEGFPRKGEALSFSFALATPESNVPADSAFPPALENRTIHAELLREDWKKVQQMGLNGNLITRYVREMVTEEETEIPLAAEGSFSVTPPKGGAYILRLSAQDSKGRTAVTERSFYVSGSDWSYYYGDSSTSVTLLPDKTLYSAGDTAHVMLQSPLPSGTYLLTVEREEIFSEQLLHLTEPTTVLEIPVREEYLPAVYVTVSSYSVRTKEPDHDFSTPDMDKPKGYFGAAALLVSTETREFGIRISADKTLYRPGEKATVTLTATEKDGTPVEGAEVTLMAVDRGVVDLINYHVPDPVSFFYQQRRFPNCVYGGDSRERLIDPVTYDVRNLYGGDEGGGKMDERKNFDPTAVFLPALTTGADGTAVCTFTLPDTLTEYRVTAVGARDDCFAWEESQMVVNNPLSVRDVLPRRLRVHDVSDLGVVVSNLDGTDHTMTVSLELRSGTENPAEKAGSASVRGTASRTVTVPAGRTVPVLFDIGAEQSGFVTVAFTVESDALQERIIRPLEIDRPSVYETVTTTGEVSSGSPEENSRAAVQESLVLPSGVTAENDAALSVRLDPTRLGTLAEAVDYVFRYPYGCLEQRCSAMIPLVYFGDYIGVFGLESEVPDPEETVAAEIRAWAPLQKADGGFPYWKSGLSSSLPATLRFAELLAAAREKGIPADGVDTEALLSYILDMRKEERYAGNPYFQAYSLFVAEKLGHPVSVPMIDAVNRMPGAGFSEKALCGLLYLSAGNREKAEEIAAEVRAHCRPTTRGTDITDPSFCSPGWAYFYDASETNALLLQFFTALDFTDGMNGRFLFNLLELQRAGNGYWKNTASTARVLEAVAAYLTANRMDSLDFSARAVLDGEEILSASFRGAGEKPQDRTFSVYGLLEDGIPAEEEVPLELEKDGRGTLFYTVSMRYPLAAEDQFPRDEGICVFVDITDTETGETVTDGMLEAGRIYRARATVSTARDRTFVALRVPVPSGAEVLNAAFATTEQFAGTALAQMEAEEGENPSAAVRSYGLSAREIYDNEVRYFWNSFRRGYQQVEFLFRTVRRGEFQVPSATAECMYEPEVFGRSGGSVFVISE